MHLPTMVSILSILTKNTSEEKIIAVTFLVTFIILFTVGIWLTLERQKLFSGWIDQDLEIIREL